MPDDPAPDVLHDAAGQRFVAQVDGQVCVADYQLRDGVVWMTHTGVPRALQGQGIAAALVRSALTWAAAEGYKVVPQCSYVAVYMNRHPETAFLRA